MNLPPHKVFDLMLLISASQCARRDLRRSKRGWEGFCEETEVMKGRARTTGFVWRGANRLHGGGLCAANE